MIEAEKRIVFIGGMDRGNIILCWGLWFQTKEDLLNKCVLGGNWAQEWSRGCCRATQKGKKEGEVLPGPGSGLQRQRGHVIELGQFQKGSAPDGRVVGQRLREVPGGAGHDEEVVVAGAALPDARVVGPQEAVQIEAVVGAGVDVAAVEVAEGVEAGVVGEEDGVGEIRVRGEAGELEDAAVEDELEHEGVGAEPAAGAVVGGPAEAVVGQVGAEVLEERVVGAGGEEVEVEPRRQAADVDPPP